MDDVTFRTQIDGIRQRVQDLPVDLRGKLEEMLEQIVESHQQRRQLIAEAMDALAELRIQLKYVIFDLEATRRENEDLKRRLGEDG
jgi:regulator of replication initiation timing